MGMTDRGRDNSIDPEALRRRQRAPDSDRVHLHIWASAAGGRIEFRGLGLRVGFRVEA